MAQRVENTLEALLARGFSKKMGSAYLDSLARERRDGLFDADYLEWAHSYGFLGESAVAYRLSENNIDDYLSDYDYARVWPLNDWQRIWINDKLTFAYMFSGTEFERYLPESYYYRAQDRLVPLVNSHGRADIDGLLDLLREKGEFACKPCNGEWGLGFHKLSFRDGGFFIDNRPAEEREVRTFVEEGRNLIYTEFFHPDEQTARIDSLIHTLRVLVVNRTGVDPVPVASYLRFSTNTHGDDSKPNYSIPTARGVSSFNVGFDMETGEFGGGHIIYGYERVDSDVHPDSGVEASGTFEGWRDFREMLMRMSLALGPLEYLGFDIGMTDRGPKLMEINSHSGCKYLQVFKPYRADPFLRSFFDEKLAAIDALGPGEVARRNDLAR